MSVPYDPSMIRSCLRQMPADRLASIHFHDFQRSPVQHVCKREVIEQLITNEKASRK